MTNTANPTDRTDTRSAIDANGWAHYSTSYGTASFHKDAVGCRFLCKTDVFASGAPVAEVLREDGSVAGTLLFPGDEEFPSNPTEAGFAIPANVLEVVLAPAR